MTKRCATKGCITVLSSFNPGDRCFVHAEPVFYSQGGTSRLGRWEAKRRREELEGKHPEDLKYQDVDNAWQRYASSLEMRQPRDVMEA